MRVLAIDPGERVGWAVGEVYVPQKGGVGPMTVGQEPGSGSPAMRVESHGISSLQKFALAMYQSIVVEKKYDVVVYETFRIRPSKAQSFAGNDMPTIQLIGMIRLCCWLSGTTLVSQGPDAKTSARMSLKNPQGQDIRDRLDKLPKSHDDAHDGDALLHLWTYYFERYA